MNIGKATAIFKDIHNEETEVEDKTGKMIWQQIWTSQKNLQPWH